MRKLVLFLVMLFPSPTKDGAVTPAAPANEGAVTRCVREACVRDQAQEEDLQHMARVFDKWCEDFPFATYDELFTAVDNLSNPYLKHTHEALKHRLFLRLAKSEEPAISEDGRGDAVSAFAEARDVLLEVCERTKLR